MVKRTRNRPRCGVAAAELAILLPFLALMFGVVVDFCRIFYCSQTIQNCAYVGALYASGAAGPRPELASPAQAAQDAAVAEAVSLSPAIDRARVATTSSSGMVTVTVSYDFTLLTPVMGSSRTITITRTVTMATIPQGPS
jgi:Flp pilus assembly protein TadG